MEVIKAYKTELNPNNAQASQFVRFAEARRFVFNLGLREWQRQYENGEKPSEYGLRKQFNAVKYDYARHCSHFKNVINSPYAVTEAAFRDLGNAFKNFFRRLKNGEEPGYPKFKRQSRSFSIRGIKVKNDRVHITGVGWVRLKESNYIPITESGLKFSTYATISKRGGRWFVSVPVYRDVQVPKNESDLVLGIDLGIKSLVVCSDYTVYENPKPLRQAQQKLRRLQRELSRRKKGGKNWHKTKRKLARQHARIANIRKHTLHQISHDLIVNKKPAVIVIEDLNVKGMTKNHHLAQAISDAGFGELRRLIEYKAERNGVKVIIADRWFASSKTCSRCGCIDSDLRLSDRTYRCAECGLEIDRDLNAALNLAAYGRKAQAEPDCPGS